MKVLERIANDANRRIRQIHERIASRKKEGKEDAQLQKAAQESAELMLDPRYPVQKEYFEGQIAALQDALVVALLNGEAIVKAQGIAAQIAAYKKILRRPLAIIEDAKRG